MGIQNWSEDIVLVNLAPEPQMGEELQSVIETAAQKGSCDVVVDFAEVDILTSSSIAKLLKLRKALVDCNRRLVFSSVKPHTEKIFAVTGLDNVFDFLEDQFVALASLQLVNTD
jgi:anti-anti-sigma factor